MIIAGSTNFRSHILPIAMELEIVVPYGNSQLESKIYEHSKVLDKNYMDTGTRMKIRIMRNDANWLKLI